MKYSKPEIEMKKFNIAEEIMDDTTSATTTDDGSGAGINSGSVASDESIGSDLIIG